MHRSNQSGEWATGACTLGESSLRLLIKRVALTFVTGTEWRQAEVAGVHPTLNSNSQLSASAR